MAKNIKAIKCPQCGSTKATELKPDYYRCNSCGTEFFLDSDDININHNYNYPKQPTKTNNRKAIYVIATCLFLFTFLPMLTKVIFGSKNNNTNNTITANDDPFKDNRYRWDDAKDILFVDAKGDPYYVVIGSLEDNEQKDFRKREMDGVYLALYNAKTSEKKSIKLISNTKIESSTSMETEMLEDNNLYIIIEKKRIYRLNAKDHSVEDVTDTYIKANNELSTGLAVIEFLYKNDGSGFKLITNDGRNLIFMPFINTIYKNDQLYDAQRSKLPNPTEKTAYAFSSHSTDYPNEKIELVKYKYDYQMGYLRDNPRFEWRKDYGGSGIFTDRDPYTKYFAMKGDGRLKSFIDLTPGRTYFKPEVLAFNNSEVMISFKSTPAEDENVQLQILNTENGNIIKTISLSSKYVNKENSYILKDGYFVKGDKTYLIDKTGKIINSIKYYNDLKLNDLN